jgi:hypothetical protein
MKFNNYALVDASSKLFKIILQIVSYIGLLYITFIMISYIQVKETYIVYGTIKKIVVDTTKKETEGEYNIKYIAHIEKYDSVSKEYTVRKNNVDRSTYENFTKNNISFYKITKTKDFYYLKWVLFILLCVSCVGFGFAIISKYVF